MKVVKRRLADGTVKEYRYGETKQRPKTMGWLIEEYRRSPNFTKLRPNTKKAYQAALQRIGEFREVLIADIRRRHILRHRDQHQATPAIANQLITMWAVLMQFAVDREYVAHNVALKIERFDIGEHARWPHHAIDAALDTLPEIMRRAVLLALYTGQRQGDCAAMRWTDYDGAGITVTQEKTGTKLWVPCHPVLKEALDEWRKAAKAVTILTSHRGNPWTSGRQLCAAFCRAKAEIPEVAPYHFHGLRKSAAAMLAEAGCSVHEIASITGHASLREIERYTREADQKRRAQNAMAKLYEFGRKTGDGKRREN